MKTDAWYERRKKAIGGSDAAVVMGLSPWKTAVELYLEKRGEKVSEDIGSKEFVYWGTVIEPVIIDEYERRMNVKVTRQDTSKICRHSKYDWMVCNPDGFIQGGTIKRILECKNVGLFVYVNGEWGEDGSTLIPPYYMAQCQHNMVVTDSRHCDLAALIGGNEFKIFPQPRDDKFCAALLEAEIKFMECVKNGTPPEPVNLDDFKYLFPESTVGESVEATDEIADQVREMREVKEGIKKLGYIREASEMKIKAYMETAETLTFNGVTLATWRTGKKSRTFRLKGIDDD